MTRQITIPFLMLMLALISCRQSSEPKLMTTKQFTEAFVTKLRLADESLAIEHRGELELHVQSEEASGHTVFLDNAYRAYGLAPSEIEEMLDNYVHSILESVHHPENSTVEINLIVPVIKDSHYLAEINKSLINAGHEVDELDFFYQPLNDHLVVFYALYTERNMRYLRREDVAALDLHQDELRTQAIKNLAGMLPEMEKHEGTGVFMVVAGGNYEASLILFDWLWSTDDFNIDGEVVVAIPSRDILLVTGSKNVEGLKRLRNLATKAFTEASYGISPMLFIRRDDKWFAFEE